MDILLCFWDAPCAQIEIGKLLPLCRVKSPESLDIVHLGLVRVRSVLFVLVITVVDAGQNAAFTSSSVYNNKNVSLWVRELWMS